MQATYSPEDNKLRLYSMSRLPKDLYERVRAAGFKWAPQQELFVAPAWTPEREDLLIELCGEVGDEDTSLVDRAEERADRFGDYADKRAGEARQAREAVAAIADNIPLGQPILVGHHSERHARRDAEKIENGMRRAVRAWETSQYWKDRAKGAVRNAKYKERPDVRARRIKGLESDQRRCQRERTRLDTMRKLWSKEGMTVDQAKAIANFDHGSVICDDGTESWSAWSALDRSQISVESARSQALARCDRGIARYDRCLAHLANRLEYERTMLAESGGTVADRTKPEKGGACRCWASPRGGGWSHIKKVNRVSVTVEDNWGNGGANFTRTIPFDKLGAVMTAAEVQAARDDGRLIESDDKSGFYLRDSVPQPERPKAEPDAEAGVFAAMRDAVKDGVKVVAADQLFPTPPELAKRVVELAEIRAGDRILEPSAGTGALLDALRAKPLAYTGGLVVVEINRGLAEALESRGYDVRCSDFLGCDGDLGQFDRIIMNPPFSNGDDVRHIEHAMTMLAPGGRLVAICANGPRQQKQLKPIATEWHDLDPGSFKASGTNVNAAIVVIERDM